MGGPEQLIQARAAKAAATKAAALFYRCLD